MSNWNGLDFFIFLIFFVNTMLGMSRGAMKEIISMMCLSVALIFTIRFTVPLSDFLNSTPLFDEKSLYYGWWTVGVVKNFMAVIGADQITLNLLRELSYSISMLICFVGTFSICEAVLVSKFSEMFSFPFAVWNSKVGAALGATRGYVVAMIFIIIFSLHIFKNDNREVANQFMSNSYFISLFKNSALKIDSIIGGQDPTRYQEIYQDKDLFNEKSIEKIVPRPNLYPTSSGNSVAQPDQQPSQQTQSQTSSGANVLQQLEQYQRSQ